MQLRQRVIGKAADNTRTRSLIRTPARQVKIRDFDGITPDGSALIRDHDYFTKRNRRFDIQIEGRFKARPGVAPYKGDEIQFGSDFDKLVNFPMTPFKLGMRVAKSIDPNVYYDFEVGLASLTLFRS